MTKRQLYFVYVYLVIGLLTFGERSAYYEHHNTQYQAFACGIWAGMTWPLYWPATGVYKFFSYLYEPNPTPRLNQ